MLFSFKGVPGTEGVNSELASGNAVSPEDKFKVPDGKIVLKSETSEPEKSKTVLEDKIETDGIVANASTKSEAEVVPQVRLFSSSNPIIIINSYHLQVEASAPRDSLPDTPKLPVSSRSRAKRPRAETPSPPSSPPSSLASPAPTLSSLLTVKMSKKRARSAPSTPPGELKVSKIL